MYAHNRVQDAKQLPATVNYGALFWNAFCCLEFIFYFQ